MAGTAASGIYGTLASQIGSGANAKAYWRSGDQKLGTEPTGNMLTLLMATLRRPQLLLLDEHTAALDPRAAEQVMHVTDAVVREHKLTAFMVTHSMEQAVQAQDAALYYRLNVEFHETLVSFAGNRKMYLLYRRLTRELALFRRREWPREYPA